MNWLSCREVLQRETELRDSGRKPTLMERLGILFHVTLCRTCHAYLRQVAALQAVLSRVSGVGFDDKAQLSDDKKARLREVLDKEAATCGCGHKRASVGTGEGQSSTQA